MKPKKRVYIFSKVRGRTGSRYGQRCSIPDSGALVTLVSPPCSDNPVVPLGPQGPSYATRRHTNLLPSPASIFAGSSADVRFAFVAGQGGSYGSGISVLDTYANTVLGVIETDAPFLTDLPSSTIAVAPFACRPVPPFTTATPTPTPTFPHCEGDCAVPGVVTVDDLIKLVNMSQEPEPPAACSVGGPIDTEALITALTHLLVGCPRE